MAKGTNYAPLQGGKTPPASSGLPRTGGDTLTGDQFRTGMAATGWGQGSPSPGYTGVGANPMDPSSPGYAQRMAAAESFQRNALRGNREGRALSPGQIQMQAQAIMSGAGGGGGGGWIPPQTTQKITPGGGNQNAFSPQAATVENVTTPGRWAFANMLAGVPNFGRTIFRGGGYDARGPSGWGGSSPSSHAGMGGLSSGGLY
jgi:hypothetical protein